jgi:hypothetical protein
MRDSTRVISFYVQHHIDFWFLYKLAIVEHPIVSANFPFGSVPQKRPPQVPKSFIKYRENTVFWGLVGAFFGEPT